MIIENLFQFYFKGYLLKIIGFEVIYLIFVDD